MNRKPEERRADARGLRQACPSLGRLSMAVLALVAFGALASGCGSSHPAVATATGSAAATSAVSRSNAPPTRAQARAFARAVNLRASDVPGFKKVASEHEHETAADKRGEREFLRCIGRAAFLHGIVEASSGDFQREGGASIDSVSSHVDVNRTSAAAAVELRAARSPHARTCLSRFLPLLFEPKDAAAFGPVTVAPLSPSAPGTRGGFGWQIAAAPSLHGVRVPFHVAIIGFVYGPATVALFDFGLSRPFPTATEQHLFSLLMHRATTHPL